MTLTYTKYPTIRIDGSAFKKPDGIKWYERDTASVINLIDTVETGQAVLSYIDSIKPGRTLTVKPYNWAYIKKSFPGDEMNNIWNATSDPTDDTKSEDTGLSVIIDALTGPRSGTDVEVHFTKWVINNAKYQKIDGIPRNGAGARADEVLLHEFCHSLAQMLGRDDSTSTGDAMDNVSEYRSIMIANIYATDSTNPKKHRPVRADHGGAKTFKGKTGDLEEDWLGTGSYRKYTGQFIARFPALAAKLALVKATFNPVKRYMLDTVGSLLNP
jgi:hypothetical protein